MTVGARADPELKAGSAECRAVLLEALLILGVAQCLVNRGTENRGALGFQGIWLERLDGPAVRTADAFFIFWHSALVFLAALVIGVAPRSRPAHLQILAGHVHANEIARDAVRVKFFQQRRSRGCRHLWCAKAPQWEQFTFIRLHHQHALLADTDALSVR